VTERCRRWLACHRHPDRCDRPDDIRPPDCDDAPSHLRCVYRWCRRVVSAVDETSDSTIPQRCRRWLNCVTHPPAEARRWCGVWLATHRMLA
jgi:hypothetical protein